MALDWHALCFIFATIVSLFSFKNHWFQLRAGNTGIKKCLLAAAGAALLLIQAGGAMADQLKDIEQRGVLRVAVSQDFPPFGSVGTDLQPQGYDIDIARYLAKEMKLK